MGELYHGQRIYTDCNSGREIVTPCSFKWDDILDIQGSKGTNPGFTNTDNKVYVRLCNERAMWILDRISVFRRRWEHYLSGEPEAADLDNITYSLN